MKKSVNTLLFFLTLTVPWHLTSQTEDYDVWKTEQQDLWNEADITTLVGKAISLLDFLKTLSEGDGVSQESTKHLDVIFSPEHTPGEQRLYAYNFLRELIGVPIVATFTAADEQWLEEVQEEVLPYEYMEEGGYDVPTTSQLKLFNQVKNMLKLEHEIHLFSFFNYPVRGEAETVEPGKGTIAICRIPDLDEQLAILYHEIGHIVHHDTQNDDAIDLKEKTRQQVMQEPCVKDKQTIDKCFEKDLAKIKHYLELGKKAFDNTTPVGKRVNEMLMKYPNFSEMPKNPKKYEKMIYTQGIERRADLFAVEELFKEKRIDAILQSIADYVFMPSPIVAKADDTHPSDMERGLFRAGFLVEKGLDINKAFQQWYSRGKCQYMPPDTLEILLPKRPKTQGARDFLKAYQAWQAQQEKEDIETLREEVQKAMKEEAIVTLPEKVSWLAWEITDSLNAVKQQPQDIESQWESLQLYNLLRELLHETPITSWQNINTAWVFAQGYTSWKEVTRQQWQAAQITTPSAQIDDLVKELYRLLNILDRNPEDVNRQRLALYNYNFIRELLKQKPVTSLEDINKAWALSQVTSARTRARIIETHFNNNKTVQIPKP